jgi:hypothetical protein
MTDQNSDILGTLLGFHCIQLCHGNASLLADSRVVTKWTASVILAG